VALKIKSFAALRNEAEMGQGEPAQGGVGGIFGKENVILHFKVADVQRRVENHGAVRQLQRRLGQIEFVVNFADDLFEDILKRYQPEDASEFVHDERHSGAARAKFGEQLSGQLAFRNDEQIPGKPAQIEGRRRAALPGSTLALDYHAKKILDVDETDGVVERALINGNAGSLGARKELDGFFQSGFHRKRMDVGARHHDLADLELAKLEGALDVAFFVRSQKPALARLLDDDLQFFRGMNRGVAEPRRDSQGPHHGARHSVQ
jgi:hypothetical protein